MELVAVTETQGTGEAIGSSHTTASSKKHPDNPGAGR
jgi:hypothetical protein